jgi:hypothetical protein
MGMQNIDLQIEAQSAPIADEVSALIAIVRPILQGLLFAIKGSVIAAFGGYEQLPLFLLPRAYREGSGDCGICFEYAVHDAVVRKEPAVIERIHDSLTKYCKVPGKDTASILFGAEKTGAFQVIGNPNSYLTEDSRVLTGVRCQPPKLIQHIQDIANALHRQSVRPDLPSSIAGLWKADLFLGNRDTDRWVGTTVKINRAQLEGAPGLRIGIVPAKYGQGDSISIDSSKNLVVCPLPYDGSFMELFYSAWCIVKGFIAADAKTPQPNILPIGSHRMVAKMLEERRDFPVLAVIEALTTFSQPGLLQQFVSDAGPYAPNQNIISKIIAPKPLSN